MFQMYLRDLSKIKNVRKFLLPPTRSQYDFCSLDSRSNN